MTRRPRVVVIGGGIAGLVAARELLRSGAAITLLESEERFGGRIRGEMIAGMLLDVGAESFATRGGAVAGLVAELGLASEDPAPAGSWLVSERGAVPAPAAGPLGIPVDPFSPAAVAALGRIGALRAGLEPLLPARIGRHADDLASLVRTRYGRRVLERLVAPVAFGVHSRDPRGLPVDRQLATALAAHGSLVAGGRALRAARPAGAAVLGVSGGMSLLVDALVRELERGGAVLRTGARATGVVARGEAWEVRTASGEAVPADGILFASAAGIASGVPSCAPGPGTTVEVVVLALDDSRLDAAPRGTGALVSPGAYAVAAATPEHSRSHAKALTHVSVKWPDRFAGQPHRHVLRLSYGSAGAPPETLELDDAALTAHALSDASTVLGVGLRRRDLRGFGRRRWDSPAAAPGISSALPARWAVAGDWVSGTGLASVVPGSVAAARALLAALPPSAPGGSAAARTDQNTEPAAR